MTPRHFLLIDPYLLIYPEDEPAPLRQDVAFQFLGNLWQLHKLLNHPYYAIGISDGCRQAVKQHSRSALNKNFMDEIYTLTSRKLVDIKLLDEKVIDPIRRGRAFNNGINEIDNNILVYDIHWDTIVIDPLEYCDRLPNERIRNEFRYMIGQLSFAHTQRIFPIGVFENITLITSYYPNRPDWARDDLKTYLYVSHLLDEEDSEDVESPPNEIEIPIPIEHDLEKLEKASRTSLYSSLEEIIAFIMRNDNGTILISKQLNDDIRKRPDKLRNSDDIERAIESLKLWLQFFEEHLNDHNEKRASDYATRMYDNRAQYRISDASKTVKRNPRLKNERKAQYNGRTYEAFLHVKLSQGTRIHFLPIQQEGKHAILLGKIGGHLPTARF